MRSDKDYGNPATLGVQSGLQVEARHSRHTNVSDEACGMVLLPRIQEILGGSVRPRWQAHGFHKALNGAPNCLIIIHNCNHFCPHLSRHKSSVLLAR
jgi:hypothetical protein